MFRENNEFKFVLAEDTERYEDIRTFYKYCLQKELTLIEKTSFYACYKKIICARRNMWHPLYILEKKEPSKGIVISWYREKLELEMDEICGEVFSVANFQIRSTKENEVKVYYLKMKGDYYRYQAEYQTVPENEDRYSMDSVRNAFNAYEQASEIALSEFPTTHPLRLAIALNFSVFFYEVMKSSERAMLIAEMAYKDGITDLCTVEGDFKKETEKLLNMINENITLWSNEVR